MATPSGSSELMVLVLTVMRVAVSRPALRYPWSPSLSLSRSLLLGSPALRKAASQFLIEGLRSCLIIDQLRKEELFEE